MSNTVGELVAAAREEGYAAGFAEAIIDAAKVVRAVKRPALDTEWPNLVADAIRALAPETKKEPK